MSVLVLQPPLVGGARRRHLALVPADVPRERARSLRSRRGTAAPAVAPAALLAPAAAGCAAPARSLPVPAAAPCSRPRADAPAHVRITRRGRLLLTVSTLLLVSGAALLVVGAASAVPVPAGASTPPAAAGAAAATTAEVVVLPGDTLWSLADEAAAPEEDVRDVVLRIEELNGLVSADVAVGDRLLVPA